MEFLRRWIVLFEGAPGVEDPMEAMIELEQQWWTARGVGGDVLWSHNVAFQSAWFEEPRGAAQAMAGAGAVEPRGAAQAMPGAGAFEFGADAEAASSGSSVEG